MFVEITLEYVFNDHDNKFAHDDNLCFVATRSESMGKHLISRYSRYKNNISFSRSQNEPQHCDRSVSYFHYISSSC